jgi:hypothetical protein
MLRIVAVAVEAVVAQNRPHIAVELDLAGTGGSAATASVVMSSRRGFMSWKRYAGQWAGYFVDGMADGAAGMSFPTACFIRFKT